MRRKLLMLAAPLALLLASLSVPAAQALATCGCQYCAAQNPEIICKLPDGTTTNCITFQSSNCL